MLMHCQVPVCYSTEESRKQHPDQDTHQDSTSPLISEPQPGLLNTIPRTLLPSGGCQVPQQNLTQVTGLT